MEGIGTTPELPTSPFQGEAASSGPARSKWLDMESPFLAATATDPPTAAYAGRDWAAEELTGESGDSEFATHASEEALDRLETPAPDEAESFVAAAVRAVRERVVVLVAIRGGQRSEKDLTNKVFYLRHPDRAGTRIAAGEDALAREWTQIRDQLVVPLLLEGPRIGPIHDTSAGPTAELRKGVPSEAVLSPLAITTRGLRRATHRQPDTIAAVVVHTTSRGPANRSRQRGYRRAAIDYALDHYIDGSEGFPHYVIDFNGTIYATCDERLVAHHAGWVHPGGAKLFTQGWTAPSWWSAVWTAQGVRTPLNLLAEGSRSPNQRTIGIELLMLPDLSYTREQYSSLARLVVDLQTRNPSLRITAAPSRNLLGHEDFTPVTGQGGRADRQGGWDPGAHRDRPWFSWQTLWSQIQQVASGSGTREASAVDSELAAEAIGSEQTYRPADEHAARPDDDMRLVPEVSEWSPELQDQPIRSLPALIEELAWAIVRAEIVRVARHELNMWGGGRIVENDTAIRSRLIDYWRAAGVTQIGNDIWQQSWSAAFVSWVLQQARVGPRFAYSNRHAVFVHRAIRNLQHDKSNPVRAFPVDHVTPRRGDIVCWWRDVAIAYGDFANAATPPQHPMHSDIVTEVASGHIVAVGGNKAPPPGVACPPSETGCTVNTTTYTLNADQRLVPLNNTTQGWVAVIAVGL